MLKVGFIGYGNRSNHLWTNMFVPVGGCELVAIADPKWETIKEQHAEDFPNCHYYVDAEEMLKNEKLDGVIIGTSCDLHTKYALLVEKYGLPLFLEKPVSINEEQLRELETILPTMNEKTVVSFPLRITDIVMKVKEMLDSGIIGEIAHVQAINNVNYGRVYYHGWYRDDKRTGGLWVTKATHDLDYITNILGLGLPVSVCAMESKMVFKGDKPAGLTCKECPEYETCPESAQYLSYIDTEYGAYCCYATDTGNQDSGTVILEYKNGLHVVYSQNFIVRKSAGKRGARFIGVKGTLEFDFNTSTITFIDHYSDKVETITLPNKHGHSGGDDYLVRSFIDVMQGTGPSVATLEDGINSVKVCFACKRSAETHTYQAP